MDEQLQQPTATRWRYVGGVERIYLNVPVTVQHGAVIEHAGPPADDGNWEPADGAEVTHLPDNASSEALELDAYGHPVVAGQSVSGPATWAPQTLPDEADEADAQQQIPLDHHDSTGE